MEKQEITKQVIVAYAFTKSLSPYGDTFCVVLFTDANQVFDAKLNKADGYMEDVDLQLTLEHGVNMPASLAIKWLSMLPEAKLLDGFPKDKSEVVPVTTAEVTDTFSGAIKHFESLTKEAKDNYVNQYLQQSANLSPTKIAELNDEEMADHMQGFYEWLTEILFSVTVLRFAHNVEIFEAYMDEFDEVTYKYQQKDYPRPEIEPSSVVYRVFRTEDGVDAYKRGIMDTLTQGDYAFLTAEQSLLLRELFPSIKPLKL